MTDLPRRDFTSLAPPPGGSADARRRGTLRRRRQQTTAGAAALAVVASVLGATVISTSTAAVDRLDPAPFATAPAGPDDPASDSSPSPAAGEASTAPVTSTSDKPAPPPTAEPEGEPTPAAQAAPQTAPGGPPGGQAAPAAPRLVRAYDPPTGNDTTVCGGRISSGIGTPRAQTGWCVIADVRTPRPAATDFSVRVCRSSGADAADLHVDAGAVLMHLEQDGQVVWRLPAVEEPAAVLRTEPAGCWSWTWTWDGRGNDGAPVPAGASVLLVDALADEVRDFGDQHQFTHDG